MPSNYPPGVTGNEPQIAGVPEGECYVRCLNDAANAKLFTVEPRGEDRLARVRGAGYQWYWRLSELGVEEVECPFAGWIDGQYDGEEFVVPECPVCGEEIRIDADEARDSSREHEARHGRRGS